MNLNLTQSKYFLITTLLLISYAFLLYYFSFFDVYHHYFFNKGALVTSYNCARLFFIFFLIWLFYALGDIFLLLVCSHDYRNKLTLNNGLLAFFTGVGIWHIILFAMGFAGLYTRPIMAALTLVLFIVTLPRLNLWIGLLISKLKSKEVNWTVFTLAFIPIMLFLLTKGIYPPFGGHDYFDHYFPYYVRVVETHNLFPNEVWYHFFYSKGDGLFFLSMLLSDPLAPQLATTAFFFAGACVIFSLLKENASLKLIPWLGVALYFLYLIYTPGPHENMVVGGWANLEKSHEPSSVLMLAIIWQIIQLSKNENPFIYGISLIFTSIALVLISPYSAIFACSFLFFVSFIFFIKKNKTVALWTAGGLFTAILISLLLLAINFLFTGIPEDQKLLSYWRIINFDKVRNWGVLLDILKLRLDRISRVGETEPIFSYQYFCHLLTYIRLDVWGPLLVLASSLFCFNLFKKSSRKTMLAVLDRNAIFSFGGFLLLLMFISIFISRDNSISFFRFCIIAYAPMLCLGLLILSAAIHQKKWGTFILVVGYILMCVLLRPYLNIEYKKMSHLLTAGVKFFKGTYSIADGYEHVRAQPGIPTWGGIYPAVIPVWSLLPKKTRTWTMHMHSYCMLPDCYMENYPSFRLSAHSEKVFFGTPTEAKSLLKSEGLNYFFFSTALQLSDPLPASPLFSPQNISKYLGLFWTNGTDTLLTWKENSYAPIDELWIASYKKSIQKYHVSFPYSEIKEQLLSLEKRGFKIS